jgi:methionine-gamma-lyase
MCGAILANSYNIEHIKPFATLYGSVLSPFEAWLLTRSMRTLGLRIRAHSENAQKLAEYFEKHPKVEKVYYPGLASSPYHTLALRQFQNGYCGGMFSADITGGERGASAFIAACQTTKFVPSLAGVTTSISYPAKTSHRAYPPQELAKLGISMGQLRFSAGLEDIEDIIEEFDKAFESV